MAVEISGGAGDLRMAAGRFARLWSVLPHLLGNALQHGIEAPQDRLALGKPARGLLVVRARACRRPQAPAFGAVRLGCPAPGGTSWVRIDVNDDGRGFERDRLTAWATAEGLPTVAPPPRGRRRPRRRRRGVGGGGGPWRRAARGGLSGQHHPLWKFQRATGTSATCTAFRWAAGQCCTRQPCNKLQSLLPDP